MKSIETIENAFAEYDAVPSNNCDFPQDDRDLDQRRFNALQKVRDAFDDLKLEIAQTDEEYNCAIKNWNLCQEEIVRLKREIVQDKLDADRWRYYRGMSIIESDNALLEQNIDRLIAERKERVKGFNNEGDPIGGDYEGTQGKKVFGEGEGPVQDWEE